MRLSETQADGATLRDHLLAAERAGAGRDSLLDAQCPAAVGPLWDMFASLSASRSHDGALLPSEVLAWQVLHGVRLSPWEAETLEAVDRACVAAMRAQQKSRRKQ